MGSPASGFVCFACGLMSIFLISSRLPWRKPDPWMDLTSFKDMKFMIMGLGTGICCLGSWYLGSFLSRLIENGLEYRTFVPFFYMAPYAEAHGLTQSLAFDVLSVLNAGALLVVSFLPTLPTWWEDIICSSFHQVYQVSFALRFGSSQMIWLWSWSLPLYMVFSLGLLSPYLLLVSFRYPNWSRPVFA